MNQIYQQDAFFHFGTDFIYSDDLEAGSKNDIFFCPGSKNDIFLGFLIEVSGFFES